MKTLRVKKCSTLPLPLAPCPVGMSVAVFLFFTFSPCPLPLAPFPSAHAADWQLSINISVPYTMGEGGEATQRVTAGTRLTALDAFDNTWDTIALGSTILSAYAYHPEYAPAYELLARDFRFDRYPQQWDFYIVSNQDGQPVTLAWSLPATSMGACLGMTLTLTDVTAGTTVDLTQPTYGYTNSAGVMRQFQLDATQVVETPPLPPLNLFSPRTGTTSVLMAWAGVNSPSVVGYHVYRKAAGETAYQRLTTTSSTVAKYLDSGLSPASYSYLVTALTATGCESGPSNELTVSVGP